MDTQNRERGPDVESRFYFNNFITPELKHFLAQHMLTEYERRERWKKEQRVKFDLNLFRDYLFEACREADCRHLLPADTRLEIAIILGSDEEFYREVRARFEPL